MARHSAETDDLFARAHAAVEASPRGIWGDLSGAMRVERHEVFLRRTACGP